MNAKNESGKKTGGAVEGMRDGVRLLMDARALIQKARTHAVGDVQARLLELHWELGRRLRRPPLKDAKTSGAPSRTRPTEKLAQALTRLHGRAYTEEALRRMARFAECYPRRADWRPLLGLGWGHVVALLALDDARERVAYASACLRQGWSPVRLRGEIKGLWYARGVWSRQGAPAGKKALGGLSGRSVDPWVADPDCSDFLGYTGHEPGDARGAVIAAMREYFLNLQAGFCFVESRKRFQVGLDDFCLDLVLYHRELKRLFALVFEWGPPPRGPKDLMDFYLTWLDRHERRPGEQPPVGIVFRADEAGERLSLRSLEGEGGGVAWYQTALPPRVLVHRFFARTTASARALAGPGA